MANTRRKQRSFSWMNPKLEIQKMLQYGKRARGVFAKKNIKKDEVLAIFGGYIMTSEEEMKLSEEYNDSGVQISENFIISSGNKKESADYFNHNCNPNAGFKGQIFLVAMKNIKKGEEITFDYAMVLHKSKNRVVYKMKCLCGAKNCRGIISDYDWKNSNLQKKYNGYFQFYLQEKINKNRK